MLFRCLQPASSGCLPRGWIFSGGNFAGEGQCYQCCSKETAGSLEVRLVLNFETWHVSEGRLVSRRKNYRLLFLVA